MQGVGELSDDIWRRVLSINLDGPMFTIGSKRAFEFGALAPAFLQPADIAELALFLASDEARFINGAIVPADGGWDAV